MAPCIDADASTIASPSALAAPLTHYVIVRRDLSLGTMAAQIVHAAGETGPAPADTFAVVLAVPDEPALVALEAELCAAGIDHHAIREPDPPHNGALMTIGLPPMDRSKPRRILSRLPLLR